MQNTKCRTDDRCSRRLIRLIICITVAPALALLPAAQASVIVSPRIPWVAGHTADDLPEIFRGRAQERILAEKVAFIMASAALLERVLGLAVDAETIISDLQLQSQTIRLLLDEKIRTREMDVRYGEDGMVEVAAATTVAQVAEALESAEDGLEVPGLRAQQREIVAVGRAALPKSPAFAKVRAMRVAEADCYERIAARVSGMEIAQETTVRQFALASQKIRSMVAAQLLSGVRFTDYKFAEDGTCTVKGVLDVSEVIAVLTYAGNRDRSAANKYLREISEFAKTTGDEQVIETGTAIIETEASLVRHKVQIADDVLTGEDDAQ